MVVRYGMGIASPGLRRGRNDRACVPGYATGRAFALHLRAVHDASARRIERIATVHGAAVVPQHHVADTPRVVPGQLIARRVAPDLVQQRLQLRKRQPLDVCIAPPPEIQALPPGLRMRANQRMIHPGRLARIVGRRHALPHVTAAVVGAVVLHPPSRDALLQRIRQRLVGAVHVGEAGIPARRRNLDRIQHARLRRVLEIRHVGVPHRLARAEAADRNTVLDHVRHHVDFRMPVDEASPVLLDRREIQLAEPPAERDHVIVAQCLSAEQQHQMIQPGAMNRGKFAVANATQIDPADLCAKRGAGRCHCDRHVALSSSMTRTVDSGPGHGANFARPSGQGVFEGVRAWCR